MPTMLSRSLLILLSAAALAHADPRAPYVWRAPLSGVWTNGGLYQAGVPLELWDGCEAFPADVRIFDENEREWPFYITGIKGALADVAWPATVLSSSLAGEPARFLEHTVQVQARGGTAESRHARAVIMMAGRDFERRVEVWGRNEGEPWSWRGGAHLIHRPDAPRAGNRTIFYEPTTVTQLQFRIYPSVAVPDEPLVLIGLTILPEEPEGSIAWLPLTWAAEEASGTAGLQNLMTDLGYRQIPVRLFTFELAPEGEGFPVKLYGRNHPTNAWRWVAEGEVSSVQGRRRGTLELQQTGYRYYKLELRHLDHAPPEVTTSRAGYENVRLVFEADYGRQPHLYFGALHPPLPRYDLQRRVGPGLPAQALPADLGERGRNPARIVAVLREYGRTLAWSALGVLVGFGLLVAFRQWRHRND
jgi:hypothetical protein